MKIYLAGPVVDPATKGQMNCLEEALHSLNAVFDHGVEIYRPGSHHVPNAWGIDMATWGQCVFTMDVLAIDECDWMVLADYGRQGTAGTAWEAGYAFAKGVKILVVKMPGVEESSLMTQGCAANICTYEEFTAGVGKIDPKSCELNHNRFKNFFFERGRKQPTQILN